MTPRWLLHNPATDAARHVVTSTVGELPVRDAWVRASSAPEILDRWRYERTEADRMLATLRRKPRALVATVVPTFNRPGLLHAAVVSALAQTITDHVVVVVSDGAPVDLELEDPRLFVLTGSRNTKLPAISRNLGMRITDSTYVALLDDDNSWYPDHLERSIEALERTGAAASYSGIDRVLPDGRRVDQLVVPFDRRVLRNDNYVDANTFVLRRGPFLSRATRTSGRLPLEDWELGWRLSRHQPLAFTGAVTARYLINPESFYWPGWAEQAERDLVR
jgi:glycosyltransferase involved in cell wall biosynthesis